VHAEQTELTASHPALDHLALLGAPRRLADREEHEHPRPLQPVDAGIPGSFGQLETERAHPGDLLEGNRGRAERPVHPGRLRGPASAVGRHVGDEQQRRLRAGAVHPATLATTAISTSIPFSAAPTVVRAG
jgi:hypothetical protein